MLLAVGLDGALLRCDDSLSGPMSPASYVLVAVIAAFARPIATVGVTCWVIAVDAAVRCTLLGDPQLSSLALHGASSSRLRR